MILYGLILNLDIMEEGGRRRVVWEDRDGRIPGFRIPGPGCKDMVGMMRGLMLHTAELPR